jgi:hypothetical protein
MTRSWPCSTKRANRASLSSSAASALRRDAGEHLSLSRRQHIAACCHPRDEDRRHGRVDPRASCRDRVDDIDERVERLGLRDIGERSGLDALIEDGLTVAAREDDDARGGADEGELLPAHREHRRVEDRNVGLRLLDQGQDAVAARGGADEIEPGLPELAGDRTQHHRVTVRRDNADRGSALWHPRRHSGRV